MLSIYLSAVLPTFYILFYLLESENAVDKGIPSSVQAGRLRTYSGRGTGNNPRSGRIKPRSGPRNYNVRSYSQISSSEIIIHVDISIDLEHPVIFVPATIKDLNYFYYIIFGLFIQRLMHSLICFNVMR